MSLADDWNRNVNHPLQSWEWGEFRKQRQQVSRVASMQIMWSKIPYTPWCFGYIPMGKLPNQREIELLRIEGARHKALGIRMEPNSIKVEKINGLVKGRSLFKPKTIILDLTKSEEELLKEMHPKGRYNIKVAQKHGVTVRESDDIQKYLELMFMGTAKRQKIYSHGKNYHQQLWDNLKNGMAHLFVAEFEGQILVADIIFEFKNSIYYAYGASALEHKEVMAPTLLLWEIIKWAKNKKIEVFDLWGAEEGKGFTRFKEQFGGEVVELTGTFDLPINNFGYWLFRIVEEVRWKILRWKK